MGHRGRIAAVALRIKGLPTHLGADPPVEGPTVQWHVPVWQLMDSAGWAIFDVNSQRGVAVRVISEAFGPNTRGSRSGLGGVGALGNQRTRTGSEAKPRKRASGTRVRGPVWAIFGKRWTSLPMAIRPSTRASVAPRQTWMPVMKAI